MSPQEQHHPVPDTRPHPIALTLAPGNVSTIWCRLCKADTRLIGSTQLLTPEGVSAVGEWTWCEICEDSPLPARRIDRG